MRIIATDHPLLVTYRLPGRVYEAHDDAQDVNGRAQAFEEHRIEVGETWLKPPASEFVSLREDAPA